MLHDAEELRSRNLLKNHALSQAISDVGWLVLLSVILILVGYGLYKRRDLVEN